MLRRDSVKLRIGLGRLLPCQLKRMLCCHQWDSPASRHGHPTHRTKAAITENACGYIIAAGFQVVTSRYWREIQAICSSLAPRLLPDAHILSPGFQGTAQYEGRKVKLKVGQTCT